MKFTRLNHLTIILPKGKEEEARKFYRDILHLKEIPTPQNLLGIYNIIWFQFTDIILHLQFLPLSSKPPKEVDDSPHIGVEVEKIDEVRMELESKGIKIIEAVPLADRKRFYIQDPFGNGFEIIEMIASYAE